MSYEDIRYQFRLNRARQKRLHDLASAAGLSPSLMAKTLCEIALDGDGFDPSKLEQDILVIRAGIEQLFRRNDRENELAAAIEEEQARRAAQEDVLRNGRNGGAS
jgi:hypothetical protein